jgi:hypothetical protein
MGLNVHFASPLSRVDVVRFPVSGGPVVQTADHKQDNAKYQNTSTKIQINSRWPYPMTQTGLLFGILVVVINVGSKVYRSTFSPAAGLKSGQFDRERNYTILA